MFADLALVATLYYSTKFFDHEALPGWAG